VSNVFIMYAFFVDIYLVIRPNGVLFTATPGTAEFARRWNPQPGDIVTFKHRGFLINSKKPKLPTLYRIRTDITWDDVLANWKEGKPTKTGLEGKHLLGTYDLIHTESWPMRRARGKHKPRGHWNEIDNRRKFLMAMATKMGFDPLIETSWKGKTIKSVERVMVHSTLIIP